MSTRGQESEGLARWTRPVAVSVLIGALCCALLLLLMSGLMTVANVPQGAVDPMASFALMAGGFTAGFVCAKAMRENGLLCGLVCGVLLAGVMLAAGYAMKDNQFGIPALLKIAFILLSAMLGGVIGVNSKQRRR